MKFLDILIKILVVTTIVVMVLIGTLHILKFLELPSCIMKTPKEVISGSIKSANKLFPGTPAYYLWYVGTREDNREVCRQRTRVTAMEYDRRIYGNTK